MSPERAVSGNAEPDEPAVGLDPQARVAPWDTLRNLHRQGMRIVMAAHFMEDADQLCERIAIAVDAKLLRT